MDFHALPRRDLQALCKRNGVRANMTNAAMADALGALPTVDGVEEYVKQTAAVPEPVGKAAVVEEEVRREKQGSPLPRGRRVTVKASEVVKPDEGKGKEDEKANAKLESNKEEDAPALGVGRRGASRRARLAPVVAAPAPEPVAEEKQGSPPPRSRRATVKSIETDRPDDGVQKEDLNREANKEDAPVQGAVRRGPGRRARAAPVAAASKAEPETKAVAAAEEMPPDDSVLKVEDVKREASNDDAPAEGVGRRGPSRRAWPAPVVPKPTAATVNLKSSAPTSVDGCEEDEKEDMLREAAVKEIVPALGVGRRGARGRARPELTVPSPAGEVAAAEDAPIPRGRRGKAKVLEPIRLNDGEEEDKKELQLEEKEEDAPAHGVVHRGPSRRARPTPVEAPVTRRSDPASTIEEQDVPVDAVLVRPTRARKPTMKAAAAAEEKVPRRTTKKATTRHSTLQKEKQQEEPQEAVPAMVSDERCYNPENVEETAPPQDVEQNQVTDEPKQEDRVVQLEISEALMHEDEIPMEEPLVDEPPVTDEVVVIDQSPKEEPPVLDQENVEETAPPQNVEQREVNDEQEQDDKGGLVNEDEILMEETLADESPVTDEALMEEETPMIDLECLGNLAAEKQQCKDKSLVEEQQIDNKLCATLPSLEESPVLGLVFMFAEQTVEKNEDKGAHFQEGAGPSEEQLDKGVHEANHHADEEIEMNAGEEMEIVPFSQLLQEPLITDEPTLGTYFTNHGRELESSNSVLHLTETTTVDAEDGLLCQDKGDVADDEMEAQPNTVDETTILHCSGNISSVVEEKAVETMILQQVQNEVAMCNRLTEATLTDREGIGRKNADLVTDELPHGPVKFDMDVDEEDFRTDFVHVNEQKAAFCMEKDEKVTESLIQSISSMDADVAKDSFQTDFDGEKSDGATDKLPQSIAKMGEDVEEDNFQSDFVTQSGRTLSCTLSKRELRASGCPFNEQKLVVDVEKAQLVTNKLPQSIATLDEDAEEDSQTDCVLVNEHKEITTADKVQEVAKEMQQSTATMDEEDVSEDQLETDFIIAEKHKEGAATDKDPKLTRTDGEVHEHEKAIEVTKEMQQSTDAMDVSEDQLETDFILAKKHKEGAATDKDPKLTGTDGEVHEQKKAIEIIEEMPQSIGSMNECVQEGYFGIDFAYANELKKVVTGDNVLEVTETEDEAIQKDSALVGDIAGDYTEHITSALLDDITKSLSIITITEPMVSRDEDVPLCKNRSEKNTDEPACRNKSENTTEPVAMQENMGVKVAKKSDLNDLTLGELRAKLRKTLERKKAKRVALARVDENVCRSNADGQEQVRKPQQY